MPACPRLLFKTTGPDVEGHVSITAFGAYTHEPVGRVIGVPDRGGAALRVGYIKVEDYTRRCGVGTLLWTKLAQWACDHGRVFMSDTQRTPAAEAFWRKQEAKGRAMCTGAVGTECRQYKLHCPVTSLAGRRR